MKIQLRSIQLNQGSTNGTVTFNVTGGAGAEQDRFQGFILGPGGQPMEVVPGKPLKGLIFLNHNLVTSTCGNRLMLQNQVIEVSDEQFRASQEIAIKRTAERKAKNLQEFPEWSLVFNQFTLPEGPTDEMLKILVDRDNLIVLNDHKDAKAIRQSWRTQVRQESALGERPKLDTYGRQVDKDGNLVTPNTIASPVSAAAVTKAPNPEGAAAALAITEGAPDSGGEGNEGA